MFAHDVAHRLPSSVPAIERTAFAQLDVGGARVRVSVSACAQALGKPISGKIQTDEAKINLLLLVRRGGTPKG